MVKDIQEDIKKAEEHAATVHAEAEQDVIEETVRAADVPEGVPLKKRQKNGKVATLVKNERGSLKFAKGHKGGGRPLGSVNHGGLRPMLLKILDEIVIKDGQEQTRAEAMLRAAVERATKKSDWLVELITDRTDGKVTQKIQGTVLVAGVDVSIVPPKERKVKDIPAN